MKTFELSEDWDLIIDGNGHLVWTTPPEKYAQDIKTILKTNIGENIFYEDMGINWFSIFDYPSKNNIREAIKDALSQYQKPVTINNLEITENKKERKFDIELNIKVEDAEEEITFTVG